MSSGGGTRTHNLSVNSRMLCQLSYPGMASEDSSRAYESHDGTMASRVAVIDRNTPHLMLRAPDARIGNCSVRRPKLACAECRELRPEGLAASRSSPSWRSELRPESRFVDIEEVPQPRAEESDDRWIRVAREELSHRAFEPSPAYKAAARSEEARHRRAAHATAAVVIELRDLRRAASGEAIRAALGAVAAFRGGEVDVSDPEGDAGLADAELGGDVGEELALGAELAGPVLVPRACHGSPLGPPHVRRIGGSGGSRSPILRPGRDGAGDRWELPSPASSLGLRPPRPSFLAPGTQELQARVPRNRAPVPSGTRKIHVRRRGRLWAPSRHGGDRRADRRPRPRRSAPPRAAFLRRTAAGRAQPGAHDPARPDRTSRARSLLDHVRRRRNPRGRAAITHLFLRHDHSDGSRPCHRTG